VVTSVFVTMARNTAGAGDRGSTARFGLVMHLAELLPSLTINLRNRSLTSCALDAASAMPHGARLVRRDPASGGHPFTHSVDGRLARQRAQTSQTAPSPRGGHPATLGDSEGQG
jgi:hypothetical protein